jgi:hypothetical protein
MWCTSLSGVTDTAAQGTGVDFASRNDDIVIDQSPMLRLRHSGAAQWQAFALLEGNRRYKIRIPLADTTGDPFVPHAQAGGRRHEAPLPHQ